MSDDFPRDWGGFTTGIGPGSRVAGYLLEEQVGAGGMAVVFRAVDERLGRRVALKFLAPALAVDQVFRQRFVRESRAAAHVDDPHIIPVHAAGEVGGVLFIAMRWVPGGDLRALMGEVGPLPARQAAAIISQVASALDAAHAAGLLHRDVKPANVLVDRRPDRPDHVYLSDFGLSKGTPTLSSPALTRFGEFLGTPLYTAPEQIQSRTVDGRADQYALACTAFEMLAGEPAFQRDRHEVVLWAQVNAPPPLLSPHRPDLPPAADQVLAKALAKSPEDRYATCRQFADALGTALGLRPDNTVLAAIPPESEQSTVLPCVIVPASEDDHDRTATAVPPRPPVRPKVSERALPRELVHVLASPDEQVRLAAVEKLRELASGSAQGVAQTALEALNAMVSDPSKIVSASASSALAKIVDWGWPLDDQRPATIASPVVVSDETDDSFRPWWHKESERWWER